MGSHDSTYTRVHPFSLLAQRLAASQDVPTLVHAYQLDRLAVFNLWYGYPGGSRRHFRGYAKTFYGVCKIEICIYIYVYIYIYIYIYKR
jgi:hypothetical protein